MRHSSKLTFVVAVWVVGCSSSGGMSGGCTSLAPIPGTAGYTGEKTDNAVNLQLSPDGINYINANWQQLIGLFAPGLRLTVPIACMTQNVSVIGDVYVADQNLNRSCGAGEGASVTVQITNFNLVARQAPIDGIEGTIAVSIDTGDIMATTDSSGPCLFLQHPECALNFNTARQSPTSNSVAATIKFSIDNRWDKRMAFAVQTPLRGTQVCGSSGASAAPFCLQPGDVNIDGRNTCGNIWCGLADWDPVKNLILTLLSPTLQTQINDLVAAQSCQQCGGMNPPCPTFNGVQSTCTNGVCRDTAMNRCVPRFLGVEGRVALGATMGAFGVPANAALDLELHAGSSFSVDTQNAINIGTRGGLAAVAVAPCVTPAPPPPLAMLAPPNFRAEAPPVSMTNPPYHMALGVSSPFLNLAFHQAHQGGVLCLNLSSATVGLLNTGLFKTFLNSLGKLTTRDGKDAPMMVVIRPGSPPEAKIGPGGANKPLITLSMKNVSIDFYASFDDRFARLFTLKLGINLPLGMTFSGCTKVTPSIGDLKNVITKPDGSACVTPADCVETSNSEILAEDPKVLADLIPAVIGLAEPALAEALKPIDLPDLGPFKLKVNAAKGVGNVSGTETYNHLGLYATMLPTGAACATVAPRIFASLKKSLIPEASSMRLKGQPLEWPTAVLDVRAEGVPGTAEYQTRVDEGLWSEFRQASGGELAVSHPIFLLQGTHKIEVRGRVAEAPHGVGEPLVVPFMVDWDPPELQFHLDRPHDRLVLDARDVISAPEKLEYSYRVGDGAWSSWGAAREIQLSAIEVQGGVTARVRDEQLNVGELAWRVPTVVQRPPAGEVEPLASPAEPRAGCDATAGLPLLLAVAALIRRRKP